MLLIRQTDGTFKNACLELQENISPLRLLAEAMHVSDLSHTYSVGMSEQSPRVCFVILTSP